MAFQKSKIWFICYLVMSSMIFSMAQEPPSLSDQEIEDIARGFLKDFETELDTAEKNAPEDPDNDVDNEDKPRAFFLLAFLPKIALILVKIAIKAIPLIIKAVAVVKAKVVATAAVTAAKFATGAAIKQTVIAGATKLAKFAVETIVVDAITDAVTNAITGPSKEEEEEVPVEETVSGNIFDYYDNNELCECKSKTACGCCVTPPNLLPGCFNITLAKPIWDGGSNIKVGAFYGGKTIMIRTLPVKRPRQKCLNLSPPFQTTKMCVSTHGRTIVGKRIIQCFSVHFNHRGLTKCLVQNKGNKVWFKSDV